MADLVTRLYTLHNLHGDSDVYDAAALIEEMLAVLEAAVADNSIVEGSDWWGTVYAAIAKARGTP